MTLAMVTIVTSGVGAIVVALRSWSVIAEVASTFLITWDIFALVPIVFDKIDWFATGVILAAVLVPVFDMPRGNAQIDRRPAGRDALNVTRAVIDQLRRRETADVDPTIETGLADRHRNADIGSKHRSAKRGGKRNDHHESFHGLLSLVSNA